MAQGQGLFTLSHDFTGTYEPITLGDSTKRSEFLSNLSSSMFGNQEKQQDEVRFRDNLISSLPDIDQETLSKMDSGTQDFYLNLIMEGDVEKPQATVSPPTNLPNNDTSFNPFTDLSNIKF